MELVLIVLGAVILLWLFLGMLFFATEEKDGDKVLLFPFYLYKRYLEFKKERIQEELRQYDVRKKELVLEIQKLTKESEELLPYVKDVHRQVELEQKIEESKRFLERSREAQ